jgi:hypothetical protein
VLAGNSDTIGHAGGLSGDTFGVFKVKAGSAAIDLNQWPGLTKDVVRDPNIGMQISGSMNYHLPLVLTAKNTGVPFQFTGVTEIIEKKQQQFLEKTFPRALLIELPSMPKSEDARSNLKSIRLTVPLSVPCPQGTQEEQK